jgi:molybdopterin-binding protein
MMKIGARNQIIATVTGVKKDSVMCQVSLDVPASKMASVMTSDSAEDLKLKKGDKVRVIVKAIHVLLLKE